MNPIILATIAADWWRTKPSLDVYKENMAPLSGFVNLSKQPLAEVQLDLFRRTLLDLIVARIEERDAVRHTTIPPIVVGCDYTPERTLGQALDVAGIPVLYVPQHTHLWIWDDQIELYLYKRFSQRIHP